MPQVQSLDDLIAKKAIEYADQIKAAAAMADKEEEIRIESEKQLAFIQKEAGIKLEGKHEFTVASGRIDSVYDRVIIEYKNPKSPGDRIGPAVDSPGSKKVIEQIKKRFYDLRSQYGQPMNSLFGVGLDGNYFIFIRYRDDKWQVQEPVEVNSHSAERFLWALFNLGTKGKAFSPEYLAGDFGSGGGNTVAISGIHALYDAIVTTDNPKAQTFFSQWKILFGEVCGYDVDSQSEKLRRLAEFYQVGVKNPKPAELLFAVHTYYALFMKLLAAEIVAFFHKLPTPLQKMMQATTSNKLKREMEDLEAGSIFRHLNITNFLEGDLFAWYSSVWTEPIEKLVREMVTRLDDYNPGTLSEDPTGSRDLLKKLYQQLFPKSVRHDLGEYYTPDWLAEHVLNELGYVGDPDKRLLDPACGSGTFLVMAINHIRKWYDENRERCRLDESELGRKILANVIGFDLNPLAVMAARTNYLIAIRDLIGRMDRVEIPVYLCDSIMTPSEYGGLFAGGLGKARQLKTAPTTFLIPTEIATNRDDVAKYAEQLEAGVRNGYSAEEFIQRCRDEGLPISEHTLHTKLYLELVKLDKANKNGIWARIIKNAFAPLFIGKVDFVAGNPPWIRWGYLPEDYRNQVKHLWRRYGLLAQRGLEAIMGTGELDFSMLFTYASIDSYLIDQGKMGFLITQEVVKSKGAGQGFRRFKLGPEEIPFKVYGFHDFVSVSPFDAGNKAGLILIKKGEETTYPLPYFVWKKKAGIRQIDSSLSLDDVRQLVQCEELIARPTSSPTSAWQTVSAQQGSVLEKLKGRGFYRARCGVSVDPYGVFLVEIAQVSKQNSVLVVNMPEMGKADVPKLSPQAVEFTYIYPAIRGKDIQRWKAQPAYAAIIINRSTKRADIPSESAIKTSAPQTYAFLYQLREFALKREKYWRYFSKQQFSVSPLPSEQQGKNQKYFRLRKQPSDGPILYDISDSPFYTLFNVGPYSFTPYKVVWQMGANRMKAAVISSFSFAVGGRSTPQKTVIPCTGTTSYASFQDEEEAHYVCALMNSSLADALLKSFSAGGRGFGAPSILSNIAIPRFNPKNELAQNLANSSVQAHAFAESSNGEQLEAIEADINEAAAKLWGISDKELNKI